MILKAIVDLPKDATNFVIDEQIARSTRIALEDVRDWMRRAVISGSDLMPVTEVRHAILASTIIVWLELLAHNKRCNSTACTGLRHW